MPLLAFARARVRACAEALMGLVNTHHAAQELLLRCGVLECVHALSQADQARMLARHSICATALTAIVQVGPAAERLLDMIEADAGVTDGAVAARNNAPGAVRAVAELRTATRTARQRIAAAQRDQLLARMGLAQEAGAAAPSSHTAVEMTSGVNAVTRPAGGHVRVQPTAASLAWLEGLSSDEEETGLACVVCQEGYRAQPESPLGVYVMHTTVPAVRPFATSEARPCWRC